MNKINIAELLKDCPKGMELDCALYENLEFDHIEENSGNANIICRVKILSGYNIHTFTKYGCCATYNYAKCIIFPKGKTTWEGFVPPCKFKNGDVVAKDTYNGTQLFISKEDIGNGYAYCYMMLDDDGKAYFGVRSFRVQRLATEEEKQKLFDAIKANGYKWNPETKTLEELPKFKDGDICYIKTNCNEHIFIFNCIDKYGRVKRYANLTKHGFYTDTVNVVCSEGFIEEFRYATKEEKERLFDAIKHKGYEWNPEKKCLKKLTPKFKVNDKIKNIKDGIKGIVTKISDGNIYATCREGDFYFSLVSQDEWELIPNKFDLSALKPYKSEILYRNSPGGYWKPAFWGAYISENSEQHSNHNYLTTDGFARYCIPYKCNEHLLGTQDDCSKYYKTWEE